MTIKEIVNKGLGNQLDVRSRTESVWLRIIFSLSYARVVLNATAVSRRLARTWFTRFLALHIYTHFNRSALNLDAFARRTNVRKLKHMQPLIS